MLIRIRAQATQSQNGNIDENVWLGELRISNDKSRGNLMLMLEDSDRIIYINTSRDYNSLMGKSVAVTYEGSLDSFTLIDIQEQ